ncbi:uncharacterized protein TEOVI_000384800 [Trypanosoma equiperdum]|uniref:Uncharacterized protein n=3 Tax=Trypanozoon TaxID=39700 RepID=Q386L4_TRYB2|nr:hypothetical protein, conserved [Trypanosoma brucei gambiense DAL972]XP_828379.1 hypothetical protein, conserved [Trypanosoma brucei brucei TREU927]EAN79267.1 hypothetical protein, conserved [Trypanosoma brucei brucei TREU927]CBH17212.1 hypothetical protein, conserved [Trypanosoma brucei gambiense DAL972]SCU72272.1 hypothetical protein, conserved [Trypanosoma equiperdum]|eukprot:XP_011779476.1 hypothetical protein, conserved [Trypanosoma brucei gambiense DAL972]
MRPRPVGRRADGGKPVCTLTRPPAPPPLEGSDPEIAVVGSRVVRLLRDARAVIREQRPPNTPPRTQPKFAPKRVTRLTALNPTSGNDPPKLTTNQQRMDPIAFVTSLDSAKDAPPQQLEQLNQLKRWLCEPQHVLWDTLTGRLVDIVLSPKTDAQVSVCAASILLRYCDVNRFPSLPVVTRRLHELCEVGLEGQSLEEVVVRESLLQPLVQLLKNDELLLCQPCVLWDALEALRSCSSSEAMLSQMVTLGTIPSTNSLVERIIQLFQNSSSPPQPEVSPANKNLIRSLLSSTCLLFRDFSAGYSHHLRKLGSLDRVIDTLDHFRDDMDVVQAAARTMSKTVFNDTCLEHYRENIRTCRVVVAALESSMEVGGIIVTRLCSVLARLVECSKEMRDWFMENHHQILLRLVQTHIAQLKVDGKEDEPVAQNFEDPEQEDLLQSVTWLVGVALMSPGCSTAFVRKITPLLVGFLKDFDVAKWHLTFIYTLMCLSNLSFFFTSLEKSEGGPAELQQLYETLGPMLAGVLFDGDTEATVEATRVLGNICLTNAGRDWMESNRCDEVCVVFLGHEDPRVVYNCFGVLLNLTAADSCQVAADPELTKMLLQHTARYTRAETIALEKERELRHFQASANSQSPEGTNYTDQIADVVEKLLLNLSGLL